MPKAKAPAQAAPAKETLKSYFERVYGDILAKIKDKTMRQQAVDAWVLAAEEGGWKAADIENLPFTLLTDTKGINLVEHTRAVTLGAAGLAEAMKANYKVMPFAVNYDYLYVGGLLHDVGKLKEMEYVDGQYRMSFNGKCTRHPLSGSIIAAKVGLNDEIINIIGNHAKEGEGKPKRIECVLIHQADFATFDPMVMMKAGQLIAG
jgi:putative nucleotidyltransferase with HDIG domain